MKKIVLLSVLVLFLCSCTHYGDERTYIYKVINQSGVPIVVKSYRSGSPERRPIITSLGINDTIEKKYVDEAPLRGYNFTFFFGENSSNNDSITIVYNNLKISFYKSIGCAGDIRNPLNFCEYRGLESTFVFTEQDYLNAEDCIGNCE